MLVLDVNVLVALYRSDHPHHDSAVDWWRESAASGEAFTVPDVVWSGFVRVVTNPRLSRRPASFAEAWTFVEALAAQPAYLTFSAHTRTIEEFGRMGRSVNAMGDLVSDAYIAACARAYGGTVVTFDRDFRKFDGVRVQELPT